MHLRLSEKLSIAVGVERNATRVSILSDLIVNLSNVLSA
ncbi:hypothetical protein TRICHSKD4_5506 [Roseibium sp. TrichSKD4]|nr:hypothetical protein TRICHSKD4_5506 [Roseibium sp. TrichSKD4]